VTDRDPRQLLEAWALDAVDADERAEVDALLAVDPAARAEADRLRRAAAQLVAPDAIAPASVLRDRVLDAATTARRAGRSIHGVRASELLDALRRQVDDLHDLIDGLPADAWTAPVDERWTVHHLVAHLVAVARYASSCLGHGSFEVPPGTASQHIAMTVPMVDALVAAGVDETVRALHDATVALVAQLDGRPLEDRIPVYGGDWAVQTLVAVRVFELWAHAEDIRRAVGLPRRDPTPGDLSLLCVVLVLSLPGGLTRNGTPHPDDTVRIVLTGTGGGTFTAKLGPAAPDEPSASMVTEAIDFCRLAGGAVSVDQLRFDADGDVGVVLDVLAGAATFATS
jgi:uncharacterized protein (TIGR03083 family)